MAVEDLLALGPAVGLESRQFVCVAYKKQCACSKIKKQKWQAVAAASSAQICSSHAQRAPRGRQHTYITSLPRQARVADAETVGVARRESVIVVVVIIRERLLVLYEVVVVKSMINIAIPAITTRFMNRIHDAVVQVRQRGDGVAPRRARSERAIACLSSARRGGTS